MEIIANFCVLYYICSFYCNIYYLFVYVYTHIYFHVHIYVHVCTCIFFPHIIFFLQCLLYVSSFVQFCIPSSIVNHPHISLFGPFPTPYFIFFLSITPICYLAWVFCLLCSCVSPCPDYFLFGISSPHCCPSVTAALLSCIIREPRGNFWGEPPCQVSLVKPHFPSAPGSAPAAAPGNGKPVMSRGPRTAVDTENSFNLSLSH